MGKYSNASKIVKLIEQAKETTAAGKIELAAELVASGRDSYEIKSAILYAAGMLINCGDLSREILKQVLCKKS